MKKLALILAVALLAAPAFAATVTVVPAGPLTADIMYDNGGQDVAAYAIDIDLSDGAEITGVSDFHVGVSTSAAPGYGIFPANFDRFITVNGQGDVDDWSVAGYTPLADVNDKGENPTGITIELGALYKGDSNKPAGSGKLCTITVSKGCTATPKLNDIRGGVVLANAGAASFTGVAGVIEGDQQGPFPSDHPAYNDWVAFGKPACWTWNSFCKGDADGLQEGSTKAGFKKVFIGDLNILVAAWNILEPPQGPGVDAAGICADFAFDAEGSAKAGYKRVFINDLNILVANWNILEPPNGAGIMGGDPCPGQVDPMAP